MNLILGGLVVSPSGSAWRIIGFIWVVWSDGSYGADDFKELLRDLLEGAGLSDASFLRYTWRFELELDQALVLIGLEVRLWKASAGCCRLPYWVLAITDDVTEVVYIDAANDGLSQVDGYNVEVRILVLYNFILYCISNL